MNFAVFVIKRDWQARLEAQLYLRLQAALTMFALQCSAQTADIRWPNANIPVPSEVSMFIAAECARYRGFSEETVSECAEAESYAYRAVVTMLVDPEYGERAVERYRGCAAGLGDFGGRYHRRKAECISEAYCVVWRYEFSRRASVEDVSGSIRRLALLGPDQFLPVGTSARNGIADLR
jgi:hypothetical protein